MASENGSQDNPTKFERRFYVLNAGWRLRMVHRTRSCGCLQREIGAQRRMASENGSLRRETWTVFRSFVLNAGWRLRMVHDTRSKWLQSHEFHDLKSWTSFNRFDPDCQRTSWCTRRLDFSRVFTIHAPPSLSIPRNL